MCHALTETPKNKCFSLVEDKIFASGKLSGTSVKLKKSSSEPCLSKCGDITKVTDVRNRLYEYYFEESFSKRSFTSKLATWVFKPFVLCAKGVRNIVLAICKATKAIFSSIFKSRDSAEVQEWDNLQKCTRSLSEGSLDHPHTKSKKQPQCEKTTFEDLPWVADSKILIVKGLKYSAFALSLKANRGERSDITPEPALEKGSVLIPLQNIGNSCYLNSFIQVLHHSPDLCELARRPITHSGAIDQERFDLLESYQNAWVRILDVYDCINLSSNTDQIYKLKNALEGELWELRNTIFTGQRKAGQIKKRKAGQIKKRKAGQIKKCDFQSIPIAPFHRELVLAKMRDTITDQHDPAYLFEGFFELLGLNMPSKTERRIIYKDELHLRTVDKETSSRFIHCSISKEGATLQELLDQQFFEIKRDPDNAYNLDLAEGETVQVPNYSNRIILTGEPPKTLALHLKRFDAVQIGKKNVSEVELPNDEILVLDKAFQGKEVHYRITSCIVHLSRTLSADKGHYISYIRQNEGWYRCNDFEDAVKLKDWEAVRKEVATSVYILTLEKIETTVASAGA